MCVFGVFFCTYTGWGLFVHTLGGFRLHVHWVGFVCMRNGVEW